MLLSIGAYALEWGWAFAAGFVLLIFVHEMGHAVALRREGIPAGAPVFIPFVGAFVAMHGPAARRGGGGARGDGRPDHGSLARGSSSAPGWRGRTPCSSRSATRAVLLNLFNLVPVAAARRRTHRRRIHAHLLGARLRARHRRAPADSLTAAARWC